MEAIAIERSIWIAAAREQAWRAVTEPEQLEKWYATNFKWEIPALQVGATVKFYNSDTDILMATIEVVDPPRQFALRWQMEPELVTSFTLADENGGTRVTLRESGYEGVPADERAAWLNQTGEGYTMSMENLKAHLEGRSIPH